MPTKPLAGLGCISDQLINFSRSEEALVNLHIGLPVVDAYVREGRSNEVTNTMRRTGGNHVILRRILLEHEPHGLNVVSCKAPIAFRIQVAQYQLILQALLDSRYTLGYLACHKFAASAGRIMNPALPDSGMKCTRCCSQII